jgi:hypothetical protein
MPAQGVTQSKYIKADETKLKYFSDVGKGSIPTGNCIYVRLDVGLSFV